MQSTIRIFCKGTSRGRTRLTSSSSIAPTVSELVSSSSSSSFHTLTQRKEDEKDDKYNPYSKNHHLYHQHIVTAHRNYSVTRKNENATLILTLGTIAATAKAGQYAVQAYEEWKANQPEEDSNGSNTQDSQSSTSSSSSSSSSTSSTNNTSSSSSSGKEGNKSSNGEKRENIFASFFNVGSKYYEGGFEDKMTRREAALILGVRESSTEKRIKEAHRKLLILNHPDTGGSTYLSGKINEAKELLLKKNRMQR